MECHIGECGHKSAAVGEYRVVKADVSCLSLPGRESRYCVVFSGQRADRWYIRTDETTKKIPAQGTTTSQGQSRFETVMSYTILGRM